MGENSDVREDLAGGTMREPFEAKHKHISSPKSTALSTLQPLLFTK